MYFCKAKLTAFQFSEALSVRLLGSSAFTNLERSATDLLHRHVSAQFFVRLTCSSLSALPLSDPRGILNGCKVAYYTDALAPDAEAMAAAVRAGACDSVLVDREKVRGVQRRVSFEG